MIIFVLTLLVVLIALYAYIIAVGIRQRPAPYNTKYSLRYWWKRLAYVTE